MADERWLWLADWGSELVWSLIDRSRGLFWGISVLVVLVALVTAVAVVIWGYATGQFHARPPEED